MKKQLNETNGDLFSLHIGNLSVGKPGESIDVKELPRLNPAKT
jgi:hypothetical protein